ncbi:MAG: YitT family protein [Lachnospiraceae bacterium]|nr:YitT family protein [Lachnospiraceae bacterium]
MSDNEKTVEELVVKEEEKIAEDDKGKNAAKKEGLRILGMIFGGLVYSIGMNIFLRPLNLYSGGLMGFAQLFEEMLKDHGYTFTGINISAILYYLMNVPAFVLAYKKMRKRFVIKTIIAVTAVSVFLAFIPIPRAPIMYDRITLTIISGIICGVGTGIILLMGSSDGGTTLIGMLVIHLRKKSSVGQISLFTNIVLYAIMLFMFNTATVIYSLIFAVFSSIATDRIHTQNINSQVTLITKIPDTKPMEVEVMSRLYRGMTEVKGSGSFTGDDVKVYIVFLSRYEVPRLKAIVQSYDPNAFIVETPNVRIDGPFLKKIT